MSTHHTGYNWVRVSQSLVLATIVDPSALFHLAVALCPSSINGRGRVLDTDYIDKPLEWVGFNQAYDWVVNCPLQYIKGTVVVVIIR